VKYSVIWLPDAEAEMAQIWLDAADRAAITAAANAIDATLQGDPLHSGESRYGNRRVLLVRPLGVGYVVYEEEQTVVVGRVWRFGIRA
jgi:plasmid stabilization system protein ParE